MLDCRQINEKLSGLLDRELAQGDRQRVELHVESCAACRRAYEEMSRLREAVGNLSFGELPQEEWSKIMNDVTARASRGVGWLLFVVSAVIVVGYGTYEFAIDEAVPALVKTGIAGVVIGLAVLFLSVLRQRLVARKTDRYKDVEI